MRPRLSRPGVVMRKKIRRGDGKNPAAAAVAGLKARLVLKLGNVSLKTGKGFKLKGFLGVPAGGHMRHQRAKNAPAGA